MGTSFAARAEMHGNDDSRLVHVISTIIKLNFGDYPKITPSQTFFSRKLPFQSRNGSKHDTTSSTLRYPSKRVSRSGQFTIAKALVSQIPTVSRRLIDNHLLIDPVEAIEPGRNPAHYKLRIQIRDIAFNALKEVPDSNLVIVMTACLAASETDVEQFSEYAEIARARGVPLFNFNITCNESVNAERMCSEERMQGQEKGKSKLVDKAVLGKIREENRLLEPQEIEMDRRGLTIFHWVVDISDHTAEEAAVRIIEKESLAFGS